MESILLRADEVAELLGLGRTKVFEMLAARELPTVRIGRCVRVPRSELEMWIKSVTRPTATPAGNAKDPEPY
jgi:excisionase family DNA binding protein